jgi:tetratricopeptide (TPR) repeat protein
MRTLARALFIAFLSFSTTIVWTQATAPAHPFTLIRGYVKDAVTHAGIEHVIITLERETSGYVGQAETDQQGNFTFNAPGQEIFRVSVRPPGYEGESRRVDLRTASSDYVNFELRPTKRREAAAVSEDSLGPRDASIPERAWDEYVKGHHSLADKDVDASVRHLQKAIKTYPSFGQAYAALGLAYIAQNKLTDARTALEKSIELDPKNAPSYITLGMLLNSGKEYAEAEKKLSRGLQLNPNAPQAHYELSKTYLAMQRWQDAEVHAHQAITLRPDLAPPHVVLGNLALRKGEKGTALKEFQEYLRLDPNGPMAAGAQQMVERLGSSPAH